MLVAFSQTERVLILIYWWCDCPESSRHVTETMSINTSAHNLQIFHLTITESDRGS